MAGVAVSGVAEPAHFEKSIQLLDTNTDEKFKKIIRLLYEENISVDPIFRGQDVGRP